jgi:hypothetical protein
MGGGALYPIFRTRIFFSFMKYPREILYSNYPLFICVLKELLFFFGGGGEIPSCCTVLWLEYSGASSRLKPSLLMLSSRQSSVHTLSRLHLAPGTIGSSQSILRANLSCKDRPLLSGPAYFFTQLKNLLIFFPNTYYG